MTITDMIFAFIALTIFVYVIKFILRNTSRPYIIMREVVIVVMYGMWFYLGTMI